MKQRGFSAILILAGVLIMAVVVGGAYYFGRQTVSKSQSQNPIVVSTPQTTSQPSPVSSPNQSDETVTWQVYNDPKGIFSIKYPQNWQFIEDSSHDTQGGSLRIFADGSNKYNDPSYGQAEILIQWSTATNTYDSALAKPKGNVDKHDITTVTTLDKFAVQGYPAVEQTVAIGPCPPNSGDCTPSFSHDVFVKGPVTISLGLIPLRQDKPGFSSDEFEKTYVPIFHKILATFKFIKK